MTMDIMQIWNAYQKDADPETIFPMYQQCALNATVSGYGDADLLYIASRNAHPEAVAWLLEQGLKPNQASGMGRCRCSFWRKRAFPATMSRGRGTSIVALWRCWTPGPARRGVIPAESFATMSPLRREMWNFCALWWSAASG